MSKNPRVSHGVLRLSAKLAKIFRVAEAFKFQKTFKARKSVSRKKMCGNFQKRLKLQSIAKCLDLT